MSGYYLMKKGEFAYNKSTSSDSPWGAIKRLERYEKGCVSTLYIVFSATSVDPQFLATYYDSDHWFKGVRAIAAEGARNHGLLNIAPSDFFNTTIRIACSEMEQQAIGAFFKSVDSLITLHRRKLEHLREMKRGLLQKMFPKDGESVPELRFPGFTDPWEQRKLGDLIEINSGRDYKHLENGGIPVYGTGGLLAYVNEALSYKKDAVGIGRKGTIDHPYKLKAPFWTVDTLFYAVPSSQADLDFVLGLFHRINWKSKDESTGLPSLSKKIINSVPIMAPLFQEQQKIGKALSYCDSLITLHQRKLEHLQEMKKGLLQQMFV